MVQMQNFESEKTWQKLKLLPMLLLPLTAYQANALATESDMVLADVQFDKNFLVNGSGSNVDVSRFQKGNVVLPGTYAVDVFVNRDFLFRTEVPFKEISGSRNAEACFSKDLLDRFGVDFKKLPPDSLQKLEASGACLHIEDLISDASTSFDFGEQKLDISIPQISLKRSMRGYVDPEFWDSGVTAATLGYNFNLYNSNTNSENSVQGYLSLNAGFNVGNWHFRHNGAFTFSSGGKKKYQNVSTYLQRDIPSLSAQLIVGEAFTSGELFDDSTAYRGVSLATDDRMLPSSLRGYAPTVRGVANSNAKVTIRQNGLIIYETTVAPGAFEINDLYPTGYGGDLNVSIEEADGNINSYSVPYSAVPLSLRPGVNRFSFTAGAMNNPSVSGNPIFAQGTWQRGFNNLFTAYAGVTVAKGYTSGLIGGVFNTPLGGVSIDATQSLLSLPNHGRISGTSLRVGYSKSLPVTGTNIAIAAYRYSTGGYYGLNNAMQARSQGTSDVMRARSRASVSINQKLGEKGGNLSLSGSTVNYWNRQGTDINYSFAYSNTFKRIGYSVSVMRQRSSTGAKSTLYYGSVTIPLGKTNPVNVSSGLSRSSDGPWQAQATVSGSVGSDDRMSYGVTGNTSWGKGPSSNSGSANVYYRGSVAEFSGSVGGGKGYLQSSVGINGAIVAHPGGVTLSRPLSDTIGIIEAPDAEGASVLNASGVKVDSRGYAVVPYLTPYSMNTIDIDPKGISPDVELQSTSQRIAPRAGSVAMLKFATVSGRTAVLQARRLDGKPLPFGAQVTNEKGEDIGTVAQASRIVARGLEEKGNLTVKWGKDASSMCRIEYDLPARDKRSKNMEYQRVETVCR